MQFLTAMQCQKEDCNLAWATSYTLNQDPVEIEGEGGVLRLQSADREIGRVVAITSDIFSSSLITKRVATAIVQVEVDNSRITATNSSTAPVISTSTSQYW